MGISEVTYLSLFARKNLFLSTERWSAPLARARASTLRAQAGMGGLPLILLGRRVAEAFERGDCELPSLDHEFITWRKAATGEIVERTIPVLCIPHPSGRNRVWNQPEVVVACRRIFAEVLPATFGEPRRSA
jgi:hypothetical protein